MKKQIFLLALWLCMGVAGIAQAEPVRVGDTSIEMAAPTGFSEDRDALAATHVLPSMPQHFYKVYVPKGGYSVHDGDVTLEDFVVIAASEDAVQPASGTSALTAIASRMDREFREISSGEANKTIRLDDSFFDSLKSLRRRDRLLLEKLERKGRVSYISISRVTEAHEKVSADCAYVVTGETFMPVRDTMLVILSFSHVNREDVALSVNRVKYMIGNIIPMLLDNN